jgi:hypothetical protein
VNRKPPKSPSERAREAVKRAAINALKRARRTAERAGVELSDWEGDFLGDVEARVRKYGRAFADPDKGAAGAPLSAMQGRKLKEIADKAAGKPRKGFRPRPPRRDADSPDRE